MGERASLTGGTRARYVVVLAAATAILTSIAGCGAQQSGEPSPEPAFPSPEPSSLSVGAEASPEPTQGVGPRASRLVRAGGRGSLRDGEAGPVEQDDVGGTAAQIRLYLARHSIYQPWYPKVGEIRVGRSDVATVGTSLPADNDEDSRKVCAAVIRSGLVAAARVRYGKGFGLGCR
jgi:hypothetical protein